MTGSLLIDKNKKPPQVYTNHRPAPLNRIRGKTMYNSFV